MSAGSGGWKRFELPTSHERLEIGLPPDLKKLREMARKKQQDQKKFSVPTLPIIDAGAWRERGKGDDWLNWRAQRTAARLRAMPLSFLGPERLPGFPEIRDPTSYEKEEREKVHRIVDEIPDFPGGDSGHFHPDYDRLLKIGIRGLHKEVASHMELTEDEEMRSFYTACDTALSGFSDYILRVAAGCERKAEDTGGERWNRQSSILRRIATSPPSSFRGALQLMFLTIVALWFGEDHHLTAPGRMDQTLRPFYEADLKEGRITVREAFELICSFYIQLNLLLERGSALSVLVGGRDAAGEDVTSDLTYLCLLARLKTNLVYPTVGLAWHSNSPDHLMEFSLRMLATGIGDPAFFNDHLIVEGLKKQGVSGDDAYNYMNSTCVEIKVVGSSNIWVTAPYFNCPLALLDLLSEVASGAISPPDDFEAFNALVEERINDEVRAAALKMDEIWKKRADTGCFPLASCLTRDCLTRGRDLDRGGARYSWVENSFVGLANLVDGLEAVRRLVYENREFTLAELYAVVEDDFVGYEPLRQRILNRLPSYGNGDQRIDRLAAQWAEYLQEISVQKRVGSHAYIPGFFCWIMHEKFGRMMGATPDGRKAGFPLADGAGPAQGREKEGPTASVLSTTSWSHLQAMGGLVHNVRFSEQVLDSRQGREGLRQLIEIYLRRGGFEIQVNVVSAERLREARDNPEEHRDLLVRVAGYSDYFVQLTPKMQDEIIERTEHKSL